MWEFFFFFFFFCTDFWSIKGGRFIRLVCRDMRTGQTLFLLGIEFGIPRIHPWKKLIATGAQTTWFSCESFYLRMIQPHHLSIIIYRNCYWKGQIRSIIKQWGVIKTLQVVWKGKKKLALGLMWRFKEPNKSNWLPLYPTLCSVAVNFEGKITTTSVVNCWLSYFRKILMFLNEHWSVNNNIHVSYA